MSNNAISPLWIISLPADSSNPDDQLAELDPVLAGKSRLGGGSRLANAKTLPYPPFKTGTLSSLLTLSEALAKHDPYLFSSVAKTVESLRTLTSTPSPVGVARSTPLSQLLVMDDGRPYLEYLWGGWKWDEGRYRVESKSLAEVVDGLVKDAKAVEDALRKGMQDYQLVKGALTTGVRKKTGNLATRSLVDVVSSTDFSATAGSEYLETLLVAIPKNLTKDWEGEYEKLSSMVVPRSATKLAADEEFVLYSVALFKRVKDEFTQKCREKKYIVRDFTYNAEEIEKGKKDLVDLEEQEKELWTDLVRLTRVNFSELFTILVHLKIVRAYVESVLRYGLPAVYFAAVIKPEPKQSRGKLIEALSSYITSSLGPLVSSSNKMKKGGNSDEAPMGEFATVLEGEYLDFVLIEVESVA